MNSLLSDYFGMIVYRVVTGTGEDGEEGGRKEGSGGTAKTEQTLK